MSIIKDEISDLTDSKKQCLHISITSTTAEKNFLQYFFRFAPVQIIIITSRKTLKNILKIKY